MIGSGEEIADCIAQYSYLRDNLLVINRPCSLAHVASV